MSPVGRDEDRLEGVGSQEPYPCIEGRIAEGELSKEPHEDIRRIGAGRELDIQLDVQRAAKSIESPEAAKPNPKYRHDLKKYLIK